MFENTSESLSGSNKCPEENGDVNLPVAVRLITHSLNLPAQGDHSERNR